MSELICYQFKVLWTLEKTHHTADALSRAPVFQPEENQDILACSVLEAKEDASEETIYPAIKCLIEQAEEDTNYQTVYEAVRAHKRLDSTRLQKLLARYVHRTTTPKAYHVSRADPSTECGSKTNS